MPPADLRSYLRSLDVATLVDLVCEYAQRHPELRRALDAHRLLHDAAAAERGRDHALTTSAVLDTLQRLLDGGTSADVAPLARRTVDRIRTALAELDDGSGAVRAELDRAVGLYARACVAHPPPPTALAEWILDVALADRAPQLALTEFADALGPAGLRRLRSLVDNALGEETGQRRRATLERLGEELAELTGDVDTLMAVLAGTPPTETARRLDLGRRIVRALRAAGRHAEAIAYAARTLGHDKQGHDKQGHDKAAGPEHRPAGRERALEELRARAERDVGAADELVRALHAEGRLDEAWRAANRYGCSLDLRLQLAEARAAQHPGEVIGVYRSHVEQLIAHRDPHYYRQAAQQLRKLRTLHKRADTAEEFSAYLAELVETHKRKTRLLAEVRNARIALPKPVRRAPATR
ncbi:hypothetical protein [Amycolatopsis arida]|uniref:hypothetical protein n=1 Tax=Amycolatopsis arida TaxID=587909 RepID=UPI001FB9C495|nr:hypothetical protein [Amycolatopsis arida]